MEVNTKGGMTIQHAEQNRRFPTDGPDVDKMERAPLETMPTGSFQSSNVHSAIYDFGERTLDVRYLRDGPDAIYRYWNVPASEWQGLEAAASGRDHEASRLGMNVHTGRARQVSKVRGQLLGALDGDGPIDERNRELDLPGRTAVVVDRPVFHDADGSGTLIGIGDKRPDTLGRRRHCHRSFDPDSHTSIRLCTRMNPPTGRLLTVAAGSTR